MTRARFESVAAVCRRWQRRYKRMGMGVMRRNDMNRKLIEAIRALVDATLTAQCIPIDGDDGIIHEMHTVVCALDVVKQIRAEPELSKLHAWADHRLRAHANDGERAAEA
jgi:hypothetical protein